MITANTTAADQTNPVKPSTTMDDSFQKAYEQAATFQKLWMDGFTRLAQAGFTPPPETPPMDSLRQMRGSIFQALSQSWEDYMRTPHFKEAMKTMLDNAIAYRKLNNDFFTQAHHSIQGTAREDIDNLLAAIRQAESRVLNRVESIADRLDRLESQFNGAGDNGRPQATQKAGTRKRKAAAGKGGTAAAKGTTSNT
jgi:hypothetical protein